MEAATSSSSKVNTRGLTGDSIENGGIDEDDLWELFLDHYPPKRHNSIEPLPFRQFRRAKNHFV